MANEVKRSTTGMREALFEEWEALRNGTSNPSRARSIAMMANTILQSVEVEIDYHKYASEIGGVKNLSKEVTFDKTQMQLGEENKTAQAVG